MVAVQGKVAMPLHSASNLSRRGRDGLGKVYVDTTRSH